MSDKFLKHIAGFMDRYDRHISAASMVWMFISAAAYIPQIPIPDIPYITDANAWMLSGAWAIGWWGFLHPAIEKHSAAISPNDDSAEG